MPKLPISVSRLALFILFVLTGVLASGQAKTSTLLFFNAFGDATQVALKAKSGAIIAFPVTSNSIILAGLPAEKYLVYTSSDNSTSERMDAVVLDPEPGVTTFYTSLSSTNSSGFVAAFPAGKGARVLSDPNRISAIGAKAKNSILKRNGSTPFSLVPPGKWAVFGSDGKPIDGSDDFLDPLVIHPFDDGTYYVVDPTFDPMVQTFVAPTLYPKAQQTKIAQNLASGVAPVPDTSRVTLTVLNYADPNQPGYVNEKKVWDLVRAKVKDKVTLKVEELFDEEFHLKTESYTEKKALPDLLYMWPSGRSGTLHEKHLTKDLTPLLGKEYVNGFVKSAVNPRSQQAGYLAELPNGVTATHMFYVNVALLEKLGLSPATTYEELKQQVPVIRDAGLEVVLMANRDDWVMLSCLFSTVVGRLAGDDFVDELLAGKAKFTDQPFLSSLEFVTSLYEDGVISRQSTETGYGETPALFAAGKAPYFIDGDWRTGAFLTDPSIDKALIDPADQSSIQLSVFPKLPNELPGAPGTSIVLGTGFGISSAIPAGSPKEKAALEVLKALQSPEVQLIRLESGASYPSRTGIVSVRLEPIALARVAFYAKHEGSYVLDGVFSPEVFSVMSAGLQKLAFGTASPSEVAQDVQTAFDAWNNK